MKPKLLGLCVLLLITACEQADFVDTTGNGYRYADLNGRWLVINYWATWCGPCKKEIPELNKLHVEHEAKLMVLGVNFEQVEAEQMARDIGKMGIEFPVYALSPHQYYGVEKPLVLPTTLLISPDGNVYDTLVGPQTEETLLAAMRLTH